MQHKSANIGVGQQIVWLNLEETPLVVGALHSEKSRVAVAIAVRSPREKRGPVFEVIRMHNREHRELFGRRHVEAYEFVRLRAAVEHPPIKLNGDR